MEKRERVRERKSVRESESVGGVRDSPRATENVEGEVLMRLEKSVRNDGFEVESKSFELRSWRGKEGFHRGSSWDQRVLGYSSIVWFCALRIQKEEEPRLKPSTAKTFAEVIKMPRDKNRATIRVERSKGGRPTKLGDSVDENLESEGQPRVSKTGEGQGEECGGFLVVDSQTEKMEELQWARLLVKRNGKELPNVVEVWVEELCYSVTLWWEVRPEMRASTREKSVATGEEVRGEACTCAGERIMEANDGSRLEALLLHADGTRGQSSGSGQGPGGGGPSFFGKWPKPNGGSRRWHFSLLEETQSEGKSKTDCALLEVASIEESREALCLARSMPQEGKGWEEGSWEESNLARLEKDILEFLVKIRKRREIVHSKTLLEKSRFERELKRRRSVMCKEEGARLWKSNEDKAIELECAWS
ncbi:hypothetical protein AAG906_020388 [Vitis piasezkii]